MVTVSAVVISALVCIFIFVLPKDERELRCQLPAGAFQAGPPGGRGFAWRESLAARRIRRTAGRSSLTAYSTAPARARRFAPSLIVVLRDDQDVRFGKGRYDLPGGGDPIHLRHLDVHQDPIGPVRGIGGHRLRAIAAFVNASASVVTTLRIKQRIWVLSSTINNFICLLFHSSDF